jgi:hypothetical protein
MTPAVFYKFNMARRLDYLIGKVTIDYRGVGAYSAVQNDIVVRGKTLFIPSIFP